jgi:hypothetical protein
VPIAHGDQVIVEKMTGSASAAPEKNVTTPVATAPSQSYAAKTSDVEAVKVSSGFVVVRVLHYAAYNLCAF